MRKKYEIAFQYDLYGNQITHSSKEGTKIIRYNEKNQIEQIESKQGITYLRYDENGNLSQKINADGREDNYTYDEWDQMIEVSQGQEIYAYAYDAQGERIAQTYTDTQDYHLEVWYNGEESYTIIAEEEIAETFRIFKEKVIAYEENPVCEPKAQITKQVPSYEFGRNIFTKTFEKEFIRIYQYPMDEVYYLEPETTEYLVDRNREYSEVLAENERIHVYGNSLVESDGEAIITGWNGSVIAESDGAEIITYEYEDYGKGSKKETGHGYNQEMKDASGLIYLRARYYDPEIGRFIQIDQHYDGEANNTASQNRYMYGLNNPYKYVDRDGKRSLTLGGDLGVKNLIGNLMNGVKKVAKSVSKVVTAKVPQITSTPAKKLSNPQKINQAMTFFATGNGRNKQSSNTSLFDRIMASPIVKCIVKAAKSPFESEEGQEIQRLCMNLYVKYKRKFSDSGRLEAIKREIDKLKMEGIRTQDVEYVRKKCKEYEKKMKLPPYTTSDGIIYSVDTYVSLEYSYAISAFIYSNKVAGEYEFTANVNEYCANGFGIQLTLVRFALTLPYFNEDCFKFKLGAVLDFVSLSASINFTDFLVFEIGGFIGVGGEIGWQFQIAVGEFIAVATLAVVVGMWVKLRFLVPKMLYS